jgi:hypothetical protein
LGVSISHVTEFPFIVLAFRDLSSLRIHFRPFTEVMRKGQREVTRKLSSEVLFRFPAVRFTVFSPDRDCRYGSAPKPGKEKQKSYDYRSAIVIVHKC